MSQAEARAAFKKATIERAAIHQELDDICRKMFPLVKKGATLRELPPEFLSFVKRFATFEFQYDRLKKDAGIEPFGCTVCGYESDDPDAKCPGCGTEMAIATGRDPRRPGSHR